MSLTVRDGLTLLTRYFERQGISGPGREARLLLAHMLEVDAGRISLMAPDPLSEAVLEQAFVLGGRRSDGEPMSHILGYRAFWGRRFKVDSRALDPRPETETLVAAALEEGFREVLDLGTGNGCILLTLLAERPDAVGIATDISLPALELAQENATSLGVVDRAGFLESNWFSAVGGHFDLIVSNPPYIAAGEMDGLQAEVRDHEPRIALTDDGDGLGAYRAIAAGVAEHLAPGGLLMVEIGPTQAGAVGDLFRAAGLEDIAVYPDLDGRDRVVSARMGSES